MQQAATFEHESEKSFTYSDYLSWDDGKKWELIEGKALCMSPAPAITHQQICHNIDGVFWNHFKDKKCRVFVAPTDVKLSETNVVQPDNLIVCNPQIIKKNCIEGTPDLIVEILSPSTELKDRNLKRAAYQKYGVKELWLVSPVYGYIEVYALEKEFYRLIGTYTMTDSFSSWVFPEMMVNGTDVFRWIEFEKNDE